MLLFTYIHIILTRPKIFNIVKVGVCCGPILIMYLGFVNIYAVSPYENGYRTSPDYSNMTASEYASATAGMTRDEIDGVTPEEWNGVVLHTTWFMLYLVADVCYALIYWDHMFNLKETKFWPKVQSGWRASPAFYKVFEY